MWIKICGIRDLPTARAVIEAGADALGFNFYTPSPRAVVVEVAREIVAQLPDHVDAVGLFVNHSLEFVRETSRHCGLRAVQLHGDESPEFVAQVAKEFPVIRAFRVGDSGLGEVEEYLTRLSELGVTLRAAIVDAKVAGAYGGTGHTAPWDLLKAGWNREKWPPLVLAGGLTPVNVQQAIGVVRPWGVDVAGGVESAVACKDPAMVREFVSRAREAGGRICS
ncbi:MAG: phosphoribosylanthranilate isomerase [Planctomycetota bacterium]|nr:phosphoribosylanthranilate isomerase [Planctomycetota bacterium]